MIKNIILDVGNVLLEYRWHDMLMDHGETYEEADRIGRLMFDDPLWAELDLQNDSTEAIIEKYKEKYPVDGVVIEWFITHGEFMHVARPEIWQSVHALKEAGYHIYLLSNYSEDLFTKHTKDADFMNDIDGKVVSYQIHKAKPDAAIYQHLFQSYHLIPEECIFYDDREENTKAGSEQGMQTVTVTSREQLQRELQKLLEK